MTAQDHLGCTIDGLKELLRVAWRDLANPSLSPHERREARNQMKQFGAELRHYLTLEAEHRSSRKQPLAESSDIGFAKPNFRILAIADINARGWIEQRRS